jgi:hypothetical protein
MGAQAVAELEKNSWAGQPKEKAAKKILSLAFSMVVGCCNLQN